MCCIYMRCAYKCRTNATYKMCMYASRQMCSTIFCLADRKCGASSLLRCTYIYGCVCVCVVPVQMENGYCIKPITGRPVATRGIFGFQNVVLLIAMWCTCKLYKMYASHNHRAHLNIYAECKMGNDDNATHSYIYNLCPELNFWDEYFFHYDGTVQQYI